MGGPLIPLIAAGAAVGYALKDNSDIDTFDRTAKWDVPWDTTDIHFKNITEDGLEKTTFKGIECYKGIQDEETIYISTEDGVIYNKDGEETDDLSSGQFKALKELNGDVRHEMEQKTKGCRTGWFGMGCNAVDAANKHNAKNEGAKNGGGVF